MKLGFIGLGKMGGKMVERLLGDGHEVIVFNHSEEKIKEFISKGAESSFSIEELISKLPEKKILWLMIPSGAPVDENINILREYLKEGDIIVDGGNSFWRDTQKRSGELLSKGIDLVDCGTSGGIWGLKNGYCLMYGGKKEACEFLEPVFKSLAPENGYLYCGESGAGHFVKMVHNGIEYGMMQSYAEGFEIIEKSPFNVDLPSVANVWMHGSVVRSWLLELAALALEKDPKLSGIKDYVQDSGEGRWTVQAAIDFDVPAPVITTSLFNRFQSRQDESFAMKIVAALRQQFGGHTVKDK